MIKRSDLVAMRHIDKKLYSWQYIIRFGDEVNPQEAAITFINVATDGTVCISITIDNAPVLFGKAYEHLYKMPRAGMPIELVTATGLRHCQSLMVDDMQKRADVIQAIAICTEGM